MKIMNKTLKKVLISVGCVLAALILFFAGFFTRFLTLDKGLRSLLWYKNKIQSEYYEEISDEDFWNAAIDGVEGLLDEYSALYSADEYDEVVNSSQGIKLGVGLAFFTDTNLVYKVAINSSAFFAGMEEGVYVTGVGADENSFAPTFTSDAMASEMEKFADGECFYLRTSAVAADDTENVNTYEVVKKSYTESYALYMTSSASWALVDEGDGLEWKQYGGGLSYLGEDIAYLRLIQFFGNAYQSFCKAVQQYREDGKSKLILDLRNNGGGSVDTMCAISSFFLKNGDSKNNVAMIAKYRNGKEEKYYAAGNYYAEFFSESKIYVMANLNSASASEALIGAMISYGAIDYADIFVSRFLENNQSCRTYGKGIMQTTFPNILTGEAAKLTTAKIYWPNGVCIHGTGINYSNGVTPSDTTAATVYGDPELQAACAKM